MNYTVHRATQEDAEELAALAVRTFRATYDDLTDEQVKTYAQEQFPVSLFRRVAADANSLFLIAVGEQFVGYALFQPEPVPAKITGLRPVELVRLFLDSETQGRRLGATLLDAGLQWATEQQYDSCWLKVWDQNPRATTFYGRKGFQQVGEISYTDSGMDDRVLPMQRALP